MTIEYDDWVRLLRAASARVRENSEQLSELDSHGGDGDHGTTMVRAMDQLEGAIQKAEPPAVGALFKGVGWAIMGVDGGATGPLFGSLFMSMAGALGDDPLEVAGVAEKEVASGALPLVGDEAHPLETGLPGGAKTLARLDPVEEVRPALLGAPEGEACVGTALRRRARRDPERETSPGSGDDDSSLHQLPPPRQRRWC